MIMPPVAVGRGRYRAAVAVGFPALSLQSFVFLPQGWGHAACLADGPHRGLIFRFPRTSARRRHWPRRSRFSPSRSQRSPWRSPAASTSRSPAGRIPCRSSDLRSFSACAWMAAPTTCGGRRRGPSSARSSRRFTASPWSARSPSGSAAAPRPTFGAARWRTCAGVARADRLHHGRWCRGLLEGGASAARGAVHLPTNTGEREAPVARVLGAACEARLAAHRMYGAMLVAMVRNSASESGSLRNAARHSRGVLPGVAASEP